MRRMIVKILEFLIGLGVIVVLVGGAIAGARAVPEEPVLGIIVGVIGGLVASALVFGVIATLLDIREQLLRIRALLEAEAADRKKGPARIVDVPPSATQDAAS